MPLGSYKFSRFESFRALTNLSRLENFRALTFSRFESLRALKFQILADMAHEACEAVPINFFLTIMIPTRNKTLRALKLYNPESFKVLKTSNLANKFWVIKRQNLENFRALKLCELQSFRPLNTTNLVNGL